ncbi:hypothetical protein DMENIID0001_114370 [Sergentomyia squamirostris]
MSGRKKSTTSSESTGSSSESSSSSGGSSSGSESGSSSSDDSDSSSSQRSRASGSGSGSAGGAVKVDKGQQNVKVAPRRRSSEVGKNNKVDEKPSGNRKDRVVSASATKVMQQKMAKNSVYSSDDEIPAVKGVPLGKKAPAVEVGKKRALAAVNRSKGNSGVAGNIPPSTGGKAPPSVLKQHQQSMAGISKVASGLKTAAPVGKSAPEKQSSKVKKKSIFSPDNSSDTDDAAATKGARQVSKAKPGTKVPPQKGSKPPQTPVRTTRKMSSKSSAESSATTSTTTDDSSQSDSETASSEQSSPPAKKMAVKKASVKASGKPPEDIVKNHVNTDSEPEASSKPPVARKLTRSSSTRKSKHLTGKAPSDTESEIDETKRQSSKSPVKKAPASSKGKAKNTPKRQDQTKTNNTTPPVQLERRCPYEGCDSSGHLGGQFDKHFTIEACPLYHNMTPSVAKLAFVERKKRDDERRKALVAYDPSKKFPSPEQKAYLQKIRDIRAKHKATPLANSHPLAVDKKKEPSLAGIVSEYDLQLFRDAQALAAENIESELKALPASKGTKYISMGKFKMDVWYQSKYPEDAARLPKLYLCEFCLRYQKSEVGMKRHAAKCVWRHPPGDEIYRKGKLGVWQVDGRKNKIYAQNLCLLAKFFLDYKTLYYDVEPFLFYVMTLADSEGCHTVGYFSKCVSVSILPPLVASRLSEAPPMCVLCVNVWHVRICGVLLVLLRMLVVELSRPSDSSLSLSRSPLQKQSSRG